MKAVINSVKHIVQRSLQEIEEQTLLNVSLAGTTTAEPTVPQDVVVGSVIKAFYLEYWLLGNASQPVIATWSIEKVPASATAMTFTQGQNLHDYPNKRNILRTGQGIVGDANSNSIPIIREWIKIPKGKQRMA